MYKKVVNVIIRDDPGTMISVDENRAVSMLLEDDTDLPAQDVAQARHNTYHQPNKKIDVNKALGYMIMIIEHIALFSTKV